VIVFLTIISTALTTFLLTLGGMAWLVRRSYRNLAPELKTRFFFGSPETRVSAVVAEARRRMAEAVDDGPTSGGSARRFPTD
jgi:hypothetical protein